MTTPPAPLKPALRTTPRPSWAMCAALTAVALILIVGTRSTSAIAQQTRVDVDPATPTSVRFALSASRVQAFAEAARLGLDYLPGEVMVRFRQGVTVDGRARALRALRSRPLPSALRWVGDVAVLRDDTEPDPFRLVAQLRMQPEVRYAEPVYLRRARGVPDDPSFLTRQWNLTAIGMPDAWDIQPTPGRGMVVAVIDTGVTTVNETFVFPTWNGAAIQHVPMPVAVNPDLNPSRLLPGRDFVFFDAGQPVLDLHGHGTHVASTIAQEANNGLYGAGLAYAATIMPLKVCVGYWELQIVRSALGIPGYQPLSSGGCATSEVAAAIRYAADNGAHVINISLSGPVASQAERDAIEYAVSRGVFVAAGMGNDFEGVNATEYPAGFAPEIRGLMSVAAVGPTLQRAYYSSTGTYAEIAAPGGDARAGGAAGVIWQSTIVPGDSNPSTIIFPRFDRYAEVGYQGTSMATPHVAGLAAMLMAQGIRRPADIETLITRTALDLGPTGRDREYGFGLIQPRRALFGMGIRR